MDRAELENLTWLFEIAKWLWLHYDYPIDLTCYNIYLLNYTHTNTHNVYVSHILSISTSEVIDLTIPVAYSSSVVNADPDNYFDFLSD